MQHDDIDELWDRPWSEVVHAVLSNTDSREARNAFWFEVFIQGRMGSVMEATWRETGRLAAVTGEMAVETSKVAEQTKWLARATVVLAIATIILAVAAFFD